MADDILAYLDPQPGNIVADCTLGVAGHAQRILPAIRPGGMYLGIDLDPEAEDRAYDKLASFKNHFIFQHGNFAGIEKYLFDRNLGKLDLLLADLGISSPQIDDPARGFSYMRQGPLDMRMDPTRNQKLSDLLAKISHEDLTIALKDYGDVEQPETIATAIIRAFKTGTLLTTTDLANSLSPFHSPNRNKNRPANLVAQVFQALRILLNREIDNLKALMRVIPNIMKPDGKIAILSFHSGEDRIIKKTFSGLLASGFFQEITPEPIRPCYEEVANNPRSRSAKLRCATVSSLTSETARP